MAKGWQVYIIEYGGGKLYTGITNNLKERITRHQSGKGCKATRGKTPIRLLYKENCKDKIEALRRESQVKGFRREKKLRIIEEGRGWRNWETRKI